MDAAYQCQGRDQVLIESNTFFVEKGDNLETLKVSFATSNPNEFHTAYFADGKETPYLFKVQSLDIRDPMRWSAIRASSEGTQISEGKPAILRYVHSRNGSTITLLKEVQFYQESSVWHLRTRLEQKYVGP
jgi:hypothetical protein